MGPQLDHAPRAGYAAITLSWITAAGITRGRITADAISDGGIAAEGLPLAGSLMAGPLLAPDVGPHRRAERESPPLTRAGSGGREGTQPAEAASGRGKQRRFASARPQPAPAIELVLLHEPVQRRPVHAGDARGFGHVPVRLADQPFQVAALELRQQATARDVVGLTTEVVRDRRRYAALSRPLFE